MMNIQFNFENKNVVVTGGAQGIGFALSQFFLNSGASVAVLDFNEEALNVAQKELKSFAKASFHICDVSKMESCEKALKEYNKPLHVLVNNAGITRDKSFLKMSETDFESVIQTNLSGVFKMTKAALLHFDEASTNKRIVNIASVVALYGNFGQSNYVAAKAGVVGLTKTWAKELGRKNYTVNAIAPGFTSTPMVQAMPKDVLDAMEAKVPVRRLGQTRDIANSVLFLASEEASYINGAILSVDGGLVV